MMDLRKRLFIIISVAVLLLLAVVLVLLAPGKGDSDIPVSDLENPDDADFIFLDDTLDLPPIIGDPTVISPMLANEDVDERYVRQLAIDFVERFGSFSNQNRNNHINDVLPLVTDGMAGWIKTQVLSYSDEYNGSTTNVIVSSVDSFEETSASVHIEAQQALETQTDIKRVYNKGNVTLALEDGEWKVSGLFWDK
jgi:hypothetical protein